MATINRFNKFTPRDYSMEWYAPEFFTPNFEQWDATLGAHQAKYDAAMAATQKYPKHLENRMDLAGTYQKNTEAAVDDITKSYMNEGLTAGNRKMRDFAMQLNKDWQPGGLAYELEQEYTDYQTAAANIDKYYKDNKAENSANRLFSLDRLKQASQGEFKQDPTTGMYQRANIAADLRPYVDIAEEAQKLIKDIKETGTSTIVKMSPAWFHKIETEEVTPQTIKEATEALLQQPKYSEQRAIELWREKSQYTPDQLATIETDTKKQYIDNFNKQLEQINKLTKNKKDILSLQNTLREEGYYSGKSTGAMDKATKEALENFTNDNRTKLNDTISKTNIDTILNDKLMSNYTTPLVKAYARKKEKEELIYNKEWDRNQQIAAQRSHTTALVSAIQSLKPTAQNEFLTTPGLSRPMDTLEQLRTGYEKTYNDSQKSFNDIANLSGITSIIGSSAPNKIHDATQARLSANTPEEFANNLKAANISADPSKLWDYFNSPGAENLKNSYISMQQSKDDLDTAVMAQQQTFTKYFNTEEGKKDLSKLRKQFNLEKNSIEDISNMLTNNASMFKTPSGVGLVGMGVAGSIPQILGGKGKSINIVKDLRDKINSSVSSNPDLFPESLRGHAFTAIEGSGKDLKKAIVEDFTSGYTLGYTTGGVEGAQFKTIESSGKGNPVSIENVDINNADLRFNVDAKGVSYYMTSKELGKDGKPVVMVAEAPKEHYGRLRQLSLEMLRQAEQTNDNTNRDLAMQMYATVTKGPRINNAVDDRLQLTDKNTKRLSNVIDVNSSTKDNIRTFGQNENVKGREVGTPIEANGLIYQKFKVLNPKTGDMSYMMTVKTNAGYQPIKNNSGGYYFKKSSDADAPVLFGEMMRQIPVEVNNQKLNAPTLTEEQASSLLLSLENEGNNN